MGSNETRFAATAVIWTAVTVIAVAMLFAGQELQIPILGSLLTAAALGTGAVWDTFRGLFGESRRETAHLEESVEKSKRRSKVERLLDGLSDEDLNELRARLMAERDGEQVSIDDLLEYRRRSEK